MDIDIKELIKAAAEGFDLSDFKGDLVGVKYVENEIGNIEAGGIGVQNVYYDTAKPISTKGTRANNGSKEKKSKPEKPRETMTFKRNSCVLDGHLSLLFSKLTKAGWISGEETDFKALFSGKLDEDCQLIWMGKYGRGTLVELFKQMVATTLIIVPKGFTLSAILEGHFMNAKGGWLTGLDKGNSANAKAVPFIRECVNLLKADPQKLIDDSYLDDEEPQSVYNPFDHQDMNLHKR